MQFLNVLRAKCTVLFFFCLCGATFFAGLGTPAITDSDEAFYAESAREMIETSDWLTPNFNYTPRFEKPILYYWMVSALYFILGASSWAARFPSALAGVGLVLIAYLCARRWYCGSTAFLAGIITATSFGAIALAHQALPDLPLAFFVTLATWATLIGLFDSPPGCDAISVRRKWLITAAVGVAGAFLVKGPVVIPLLLVVLGPISILEYVLHGARWRVRAIDIAVAFIVFIIITTPWYFAMTIEHGVSYLDRFFLTENIDRFSTPRYNAPRPSWYYLPIIFGGLLPWSLFMPLWVPNLARAWRQRMMDVRAVRLSMWAAGPLIFYTASIGKQPRYIIPVLIPLAVLVAHAIVNSLRTLESRRRLFICCSSAVGITTIALGVLVYRTRTLLTEWGGSEPVAVAVSLTVVGLAILVASLWSGRRASHRWAHSIPALVLTSAIVAALGAHYIILATPGLAPVQQMASMVKAARPNNEPYGRHRVFDRNLIYYVGAQYVELPIIDAARDFLRSPERVLCVLRSEDAKRLKSDGLALREIGSVSYLNTGSLTFRMLLNPDPDRYRQHVVLVTNQW